MSIRPPQTPGASTTPPARRRGLAALAFLPLAVVFMGADRGCVTSPTPDTIVVANPTIKGNISEFNGDDFVATHDGSARLKVNNVWQPWVATVDKVWTYNNVALNVGTNELSGSTFRSSGMLFIFGTINPLLLDKRTDLASQGQQKVFLDWSDAGIDDQIKAIATHSLDGPLSAADLNTFVAGVKAEVVTFFEKAYSGKNVVLVPSFSAGTHTVKYHGEDSCSLYGQSPGDFKSLIKQQQTEVYIGSFKCTVVDNNQLLTETPAKKTDTMAVRIVDIGTFIGRTTAHEVGHSLGLVAEPSGLDQRLHGCEGTHNCEGYDQTHPSDRFDIGHHIMDPGPKSELYARIGQDGPVNRKAHRPFFEAYSRSYLEIVHP